MAPVASDGPGDALAQPTRARLFAHLSGLARPAETNELAAELGLHPSGVRVHLERLRAAGLVARERAPQPHGRPRDRWSVAPDALSGGEPRDAYRRLAGWLARSIPPRPVRLREIERSGRELGRELKFAAGSGSSAEETMGRSLTALGFAPQRERGKLSTRRLPGSATVRIARPSARTSQVVCTLHRGLTRGLVDELEPTTRLTRFVPEDPDRADA